MRVASVATRALGCDTKKLSRQVSASAPEMRIIATPATPDAVAGAKMVSFESVMAATSYNSVDKSTII
jgi:hypothetical protein